MHFSARLVSASGLSLVLIIGLAHCVADDPTTNGSSADDGGSNDGTTTLPDGNTVVNEGGGGNDSGPPSCVPKTGLAAGAVDPTFGSATVTLPSSFVASAAAVDSMDRVVVVGTMNCPTIASIAAARFTAAGALDTTFNGTGTSCLALPASETSNGAYAVIAPVTDDVYLLGSGGSHQLVTRLLSTGAVDTANFGTGGYYLSGAPNNHFFTGAMQGDALIAAGAIGSSSQAVRINTIGQIDGQFAPFGTSSINSFMAIAVADGGGIDAFGTHSDQHIFLLPGTRDGDAGPIIEGDFTSIDVIPTNAIARADGTLIGAVDPINGLVKIGLFDHNGLIGAFGSSGITSAPFTTAEAAALRISIAQQCDGKVVTIGGTADGDGGAGNLLLARFLSTGALDTAFGTAGKTTFTEPSEPIAVLATSTGFMTVVSTVPRTHTVKLTRFSQ